MSDSEQRLAQEAQEFARMAASKPPVAGEPTERIHPAASVIVVRESGGPELEVLLVRRSPGVRFMPGAWVFPGGKLDDADGGDDLPAFMSCAVREAEEEVGIMLPDSEALVWFSHWITPQGLPHRFDTRFFLAAAPADAEPKPDDYEVDAACWITPSNAIAENEADTMTIFFPTLKQLERLIDVATIEAAFELSRAAPIEPITPKVVLVDGVPHIRLPGEPGYDD